MKTLKTLSVLFISTLLLVSCNNDDSNTDKEIPNVIISQGGYQHKLFITNNFLDKIVNSYDYTTTFIYNSQDKVEKITLYKPDGSILNTLEYFYKTDGTIDFIKNVNNGYNTYSKYLFQYTTSNDINIQRNSFYVSDNSLYGQGENYTLTMNNNNVSSFQSQTFTYSSNENNIYGSLKSVKELAISNVMFVVLQDIFSDLNCSSNTTNGVLKTYEYEFNSNNKISKRKTFNSSNEQTGSVTYEYFN